MVQYPWRPNPPKKNYNFTILHMKKILSLAIFALVLMGCSSATNIYTNQQNNFSFSYPKDFNILVVDENTISLVEDGTDGPWIIGMQISDTNLQVASDWVKSENSKHADQPPITITEVKKYKAGDVSFLETPVVIDSDSGKPIYANQESAILIKDKKIYTFSLRAQVEDSALKKVFLEIIQSFNFTTP
jgi:hypothetical protein